MLVVKKRSGKEEPFDMEKIKQSLANASDVAGQPLTASDINNIAGEIKGLVEGRETMTSRQLYIIVAGVLSTKKLNAVLDKYIGYNGNAWM